MKIGRLRGACGSRQSGRRCRRQRRQQNVLLSILTQKCTRAKHKVAGHLGRPTLGKDGAVTGTGRDGQGLESGSWRRAGRSRRSSSSISYSYKIKYRRVKHVNGCRSAVAEQTVAAKGRLWNKRYLEEQCGIKTTTTSSSTRTMKATIVQGKDRTGQNRTERSLACSRGSVANMLCWHLHSRVIKPKSYANIIMLDSTRLASPRSQGYHVQGRYTSVRSL